jgi:hypothetical protein
VDVDVFLTGPNGIEAAKAFATATDTRAQILHKDYTPYGTVMATTADTRTAVPQAAIQFVFGMFGSSQEQVLQSFDADVVAAGLRKTAAGIVELGTAPSTKAAWASGVATIVNGNIIHAGRFGKLYAKGFHTVKFASTEAEAAAKVCIAGPENLSHGKFAPSVHADVKAMICAPTLEEGVALLTAAREKCAAEVAKARAARDVYFQDVVSGTTRVARQSALLSDDVHKFSFFLADEPQRFEDAWSDAIARGVLTASYRKTGLDMFYGHTYISRVAEDGDRVKKFLESVTSDFGPILDICLRVFEKVLQPTPVTTPVSKRVRVE